MEKLLSLFIDLKNVLFPEICPGCQDVILPEGRLLCTGCLFEMPFTDHFDVADNKVASHFYGRVRVKAAAGLLYFTRSGYVQDIMHAFKYQAHRKVGSSLGKIAGEKMLSSPFFRKLDLIIPVPLHAEREFTRGYNQSRIFAEGITSVLGVPTRGDILVKNKNNTSQTGKNRVERVENVCDVYRLLHHTPITGKDVLLVDDVITTGSTLEACIRVMEEARPKSISVVTLACAL